MKSLPPFFVSRPMLLVVAQAYVPRERQSGVIAHPRAVSANLLEKTRAEYRVHMARLAWHTETFAIRRGSNCCPTSAATAPGHLQHTRRWRARSAGRGSGLVVVHALELSVEALGIAPPAGRGGRRVIAGMTAKPGGHVRACVIVRAAACSVSACLPARPPAAMNVRAHSLAAREQLVPVLVTHKFRPRLAQLFRSVALAPVADQHLQHGCVRQIGTAPSRRADTHKQTNKQTRPCRPTLGLSPHPKQSTRPLLRRVWPRIWHSDPSYAS